MFDIAVVGAGPAGATLARLLAGQYRVLLIDRRGNGSPGKCCGGLLAPDAQRMLAELGLGLPTSVLAEPQIFAVRAVDLPSAREGLYQRHYLNIKRAAFEDWLRSLLPPAVDFRPGCLLRSFATGKDGYRLSLSAGNRIYMEKARILIGADGAASIVRRLAFPGKPRPRTYLALQEYYEAGTASPFYTAIFDPAVTDYYAWAIPKDGRLILGAALSAGSAAKQRFALLREKLGRAGWRLERPCGRDGAFLVRPGAGDVLLGQKAIGLVGEAAGLVSPSSGEGISYALHSAVCLAAALPEGLRVFCGVTPG